MEKQISNELPRLRVQHSQRGKSGCYLVSADIDQKEKHSFKGDNGETFSLILPKDENNNLKEKLPNEAIVEAHFGDTDFEVGTRIFIEHFVLLNHDMSSNHIYEDANGKRYWSVENHDVYAGVVNGELVANSDILLCEYLEDKLLSTSLSLSGSLNGKRQDVAKVVSNGDKNYPAGTYVLVEDYALYELEFNGKKYGKLELNMEDVIGVVFDPSVRKNKLLDMDLSRA